MVTCYDKSIFFKERDTVKFTDDFESTSELSILNSERSNLIAEKNSLLSDKNELGFQIDKYHNELTETKKNNQEFLKRINDLEVEKKKTSK